MSAEDATGTTGAPSVPSTTSTVPGLPAQATMGLLGYITAHSLDEDYDHVSRRGRAAAGPRPHRGGLAAMLVLGMFGILVATAFVQTSRNAVASEDGRDQLVTQIQARGAQVEARRDRVTELRGEVSRLRAQDLAASSQGRALTSRLGRLGVHTGFTAVTGPGVQVVVDDNPDATSSVERVLDKDLQKLANALWESGAEAMSFNGQRLTNLSAIRHAGSAITVNGRSLSPPYTVLAVGDPDSIPARFVETKHGSAWLDYQAAYGLQFDMTSEESLKLPAASRLDLRYARTPGAGP